MLDPKLARDSYLTGTNVLPGNPDVVHHVILFRVPPDQVDEAQRLDNADQDEGWTCFGGSGVAGEVDQLNDAPWLGAWAPGGSETKTPDGYGVDLPRGSRIIMQVHYNLLADVGPDMSSTQIRLMPHRPDITDLHTFLMPAPVELPCRPVTTRRRCAIATRPSPTRGSGSGWWAVRWPRGCTTSAARSRVRTRSAPAPAPSPGR